MDPHAVNAMGMQGGMSMPMSGANGSNPQAMAMGMNGMAMNAYGVPQPPPQQQQMMMNMGQMNMGSMAMKMNPNAMNPAAAAAAAAAGGPGMQQAQGSSAGADWRIQLTREHRANLIAKIYNEMVRVSADPVPGIKLWMNVSWYELTLYKESRTQEEYINKIFTRLKSLRAQQTDMNAVMAAQALPNQGMLSRLDFSYYNTLNLNQARAGVPGANGAPVGGYPGHPQFGGPTIHPGAQQPQSGKPMAMGAGGMPANPAAPNGVNTTPRTGKPEGGIPGDMTAEYWRQHAALKSKYHDDVEKVHSAFKKYVDHMKGHDETEQKKKLRYLLSYVQLCASILNEDKTTHPPRKIEELDKVYKYIVKIVNPYLKKLRTETDKRSFTPNAASGNGTDPAGVNPSTSINPVASAGPPSSAGAATASANTPNGPSGGMQMQQQQQGQQQQPQPQQNLSLQQKQQQYLMQQRAQQMQQQQQRMQAARQQQMMQQQHMMQQQQQQKGPPQAQHSAQQTNQANALKQQNGQPSGAQQTPPPPQQQKQQQQTQQAQRPPAGQQQHAPQPTSQQPRQPQQPQSQQHQTQQQQPPQKPQQELAQQQQQQTAATSRADTSSLSLDDSLYGGMDSSGLMQMPSNLASSGSSSSGFMSFPNDLSPTNFSGMDLLDMDGFMGQDGNGNAGPGASGQNNSNSSGGNNTNSGDGGDSDLMFMEAL